MNIRTLTLGDYQTNCYLVSDENGDTAVIDPGDRPEEILNVARAQHLTIRAVLLTHGHFDHVGAVRGIAEAMHCPVYVGEKDLSLPAPLRGGLVATDTYGDRLCVGSLTFDVLPTPGHTAGSVCLRCGDALFSGDTLFAGSCGRTDLGGDAAQLAASLSRLAALKEPLVVYPGHGPKTTLEREKACNPYLRVLP